MSRAKRRPNPPVYGYSRHLVRQQWPRCGQVHVEFDIIRDGEELVLRERVTRPDLPIEKRSKRDVISILGRYKTVSDACVGQLAEGILVCYRHRPDDVRECKLVYRLHVSEVPVSFDPAKPESRRNPRSHIGPHISVETGQHSL